MAWMDEIFRFVMGGRKPDGTLDECQLDADKNLKVVVVASAVPPPLPPPPAPKASWDDPPGYLSQRVVKPAPGTLFQFFGFTETAGFIHLFDETAPPPDGSVPAISIPVWGWGSPFALPLNAAGRDFTKGICWVFSTTPETLKRSASAQVWANAQRL